MYRHIVTLLLICSCYISFGEPNNSLGTFAAKYRFVDSIGKGFRGDDYYNNFNVIKVAIDNLEKWAGSTKDKELIGEVELLKIKSYERAHVIPVPDAEHKFQVLAKDAHFGKLYYVEADAIQSLARLYIDAGSDAKGFENCLLAYTIYSTFTSNEFPPKEQFLFFLGSAYYRYGDNENALKYIKEATELPTFVLRKNGYTEYNTIGLCYQNLGKYDSAEWYFRAVYDLAKPHNDSVWAGIVLGNIGITYFYQHKYDLAIPILENDINVSLRHSVVRNAVGSMYILALLYYQQHNMEKSEKMLTDALRWSREKHFWNDYGLSEKLYTLMFKIYSARSEQGLAAIYADSALNAKDSNIAHKNMLVFAKMQGRVDMFQHRLATEQLENQRRVEILIRNSLIGGIVLLTIIGILFFNRQKLKQKKLEVEKRNAEAELETATAKLDNFRLSVLEKNKAIEQYTSEIERLNKDSEEQTENEILVQLEQSTILTDEQWDDFRDLFEKVHKGFFVGLKKKLPDLTQAEVRFLALTKLKLSSKEMAAMLGISPNAIRIYRYRLRKKLNMDKDDMIEALVNQL